MRSRSKSSSEPDRPRVDQGFSLVEVLVSIMLIGTVTVAMLTTLRISVKASALDRDHINSHAWLQTATDILYGDERVDCGTVAAADENAVFTAYDLVVQGAPKPLNWNGTIEIVRPILFWNGDVYTSTCYDDMGINLQLITLRVKGPDNKIIESIQIVKG
jgi:prepilin-type N-terminal cleavage/methylation domain-containing protein